MPAPVLTVSVWTNPYNGNPTVGFFRPDDNKCFGYYRGTRASIKRLAILLEGRGWKFTPWVTAIGWDAHSPK